MRVLVTGSSGLIGWEAVRFFERQHAGVELHGFLNYLMRVAMREGPYTVVGFKGK